RVNFLKRVLIETNNKQVETHCLDISLKGILLVRPENSDLNVADAIKVILVLSPEEVIVMQGCLVHLDDEVVGCESLKMDVDSLTSLRRLLELNLADADE